MAEAARPAFVVGAEVDHDEAFAEVVALAEAHRARVWAAPMSSRCCFPESHPLFAGFLPPTRTGIAEALRGSDVVLVLGAPVFTYHVESGGSALPEGAALYQLTADAGQAAWTPAGTSVVTSLRRGVLDLMEYPARHQRTAPPPRPKPAAVPAADSIGAITPAFLMDTLARLRPPGSVIVEEAPSSRPVMCEYLPNDEPGSFSTCASGGLGHGLPAAVGMMLARPDRRVIAVIGDGSAMYAVQALWNAARLGEAPLTVIIVANGVYQTLYNFADRFGVGKPVGSDLPGLDFVGLAGAQGCRAERVARPEDLEAVLGRVLTEPGPPCLVEVTVTEPASSPSSSQPSSQPSFQPSSQRTPSPPSGRITSPVIPAPDSARKR
ncbi:MAG TPA: thiamine pyrophosphate-dependent enzyme [Actinospica sp.]|nr:thiamine pyrophosphate-dependent enzyme [Actinospica sp.]